MAIRGVAIAAAALAVGSAPLAWLVSIGHQPDPGVAVASDPARVAWVLPGGPAWNDGVRVGQVVRSVEHGDGDSEWRLVVTASDGVDYASSAASHEAALRATAPFAAGAGLLAMIAVIAARRRLWLQCGSVAVVGVAAASWPALMSAQPVVSEAAALAGVAVPMAWLVTPSHRARLRTMAAMGLIALTVAWLLGRLWLPPLFDPAEALRITAVGVLAALSLAQVFAWRALFRPSVTLDTSRAGDVAGMVAVATGVVGVALLAELPLWLAGAAAAAVALAFPPARRRSAQLLDRVLLSDQREQARMSAVEEERLRLASEIHDVPLQEISGVIRSLERVAGTLPETEALRGVAEHLRDITGELHPPVLADLGLGPALQAAAEDAHRLGPPAVNCGINDDAGVLHDQRPPRSVELAIFRIVVEALTNARLHAHAETITVTGRVSSGSIELAVRDDGIGLDRGAIRSAQQSGHLGITSMAQRADAIGAQLLIGGESPGTVVSVRWDR